ncbi:DUF5696 domain-containing protein [Cohnella sp. 56]|uniref:DUF5696 domain-containing protein n=1 Tax=Cohnella sp. 56 TaxID=3113722 RepID=UPI0030E8CA51
MRARRIQAAALMAVLLAGGVAALSGSFAPEKKERQTAHAAEADGIADVRTSGEAARAPAATLASNGAAQVDGMDLVAENGRLGLYLNRSTAEIAVRDAQNGQVWFSNPQHRDADTIASSYEKDALASQVSLTYLDVKNTRVTLLSYTDSVSKKQFEVFSIPGGIRVEYTFGDNSKGIDALPKLISKERMRTLVTDKLTESEAKYLLRQYPLNDQGIHERFDLSLSKGLVLDRVVKDFQEAGYTEEDLRQDNEENQVTEQTANARPSFMIPVEYRLDGNQLVATIVGQDVKESAGNKLTRLELLRFMGAAGPSDEGYMLIPDGSGSLIHLNNGKTKDDAYVQRLYGADLTNSDRNRPQISETARLPVFGIKSGERALVGIIEEGDAMASIQADVGGKLNSYNYIYGSFLLRSEDSVLMPGTGSRLNTVQLVQATRYKGNMSVRYGFLYDGEASLGGMADMYRARLLGGEQPTDAKRSGANGALPFFLDVAGDIPIRKSVLGIPYASMEPLTTFRQAGAMVSQLNDKQVGNVNLRYLGWFNKGVNHKVPTHLSVDGAIGGAAGLKSLADSVVQAGGRLYPDVAFQKVYQDGGAFSPAKDAARFVTKDPAKRYPYDLARMRQTADKKPYYLLSPSRLAPYAESFAKAYERLGIPGLSLRDLGDDLHSDYRDGRTYDRQAAEAEVVKQIAALSRTAPDLLVAGGNAYALPYAAQIVDAPLGSSGFNLADETVPFYQMVLHGYVDYAGEAMNLGDEQDPELQLLKLVEYGASPHFLLTDAPSSKTKYTAFDDWYSIGFQDWADTAAELYARVAQALQSVRGARMSSYEKLQEGVYKTGYDNGRTIVVNYTDAAYRADGIVVPAKSFLVGEGEGS